MKVSDIQIKIIQDYFKTQPVLKAFLFGSVARGEADQKSDLDILVELDYSKHIGLGFVGMQQDLEDLLHCKVDLVSDKSLSPHIRPAIEKEKLMVYER
ncbi:hypothetical protein BH09BAC1_BH09BAC1_20180 [soil metagenome]